ncbi:MAG: D-alanine--D-alanine ligase [Gammaproteobacteria bacterium]|nr:D-alanine--D-alanine ligase [Gammaproteobacteria bacterium]
MSKKLQVAIVFGGRSAEHEVSLQSARNVINALDKSKYEPVLVAIDRDGNWYLNSDSIPLLNEENPEAIRLNRMGEEVTFIPRQGKGELIGLGSDKGSNQIDVVFPVLHGPYGEDGSIQGLMKLANLPFVGSGILGSAVSMDKDISKRLLRQAGLPVADYIVIRNASISDAEAAEIGERLGLPVFVKPANQGSSVGISRAGNEKELIAAIQEAAKFDRKILVEQSITGREIECAVLGNEQPIASIAGEIIAADGFYSYDAKYIDENGAILEIPARISPSELEEIQQTAIRAFQALECTGMARVDMFLTKDGNIYVNEINTIPGFTKISMYPKLWDYSGIAYPELIDRLIQLAIEEHKASSSLRITR